MNEKPLSQQSPLMENIISHFTVLFLKTSESIMIISENNMKFSL